ncbi:hypothetical protein OI18_04625 [Flavihumibacter solisilvae]|uniref:RND efflux pump membrane fusion protein barrel-sandwich domain-containing protein n=2 Tax=Flavihumibacter solisilvae TaxID=1349421 RepID=A0A0C1IMX0_9BACT|nr:hypothetical protein OI18_04625 [Flavihumibacter solisilvae]
MFFITVDVVAIFPAITRQNGETIPIHSRKPGIIDSIYISNGDSISAGDKIAKLHDAVSRKTILTLRKASEDLKLQIGRLEILGVFASQYPVTPGEVNVKKSDRQYQLFMANHSAWNVKLKKAEADLELTRVLCHDNIVAPAELAAAESKFQEINTAFKAFISGQVAAWEKERQLLSERLWKLEMDIFNAEEEYKSHYIHSPVAGVVTGLKRRVENDNIAIEDVFCFVSPFDSLVIESYVTPSAIAFLSPGQPVYYSFNIAGADHLNIAPGRIVVVSPVMEWNSSQPVYRVLSSPPDNNGDEIKDFHLVAGVTLKSRFLVTERKLWQLVIGRFRQYTQPIPVIK